MGWTVVESSTIAAVGYEDGAEYPLGVQFKPTKMQVEQGKEKGSVYEYANVTPEIFAALVGAKDNPEYGSVGKFFEWVIKAHPEQYPYRKVDPSPQAE
jgi:hypothetical protein